MNAHEQRKHADAILRDAMLYVYYTRMYGQKDQQTWECGFQTLEDLGNAANAVQAKTPNLEFSDNAQLDIF
jgi:hypothetical protein